MKCISLLCLSKIAYFIGLVTLLLFVANMYIKSERLKTHPHELVVNSFIKRQYIDTTISPKRSNIGLHIQLATLNATEHTFILNNTIPVGLYVTTNKATDGRSRDNPPQKRRIPTKMHHLDYRTYISFVIGTCHEEESKRRETAETRQSWCPCMPPALRKIVLNYITLDFYTVRKEILFPQIAFVLQNDIYVS